MIIAAALSQQVWQLLSDKLSSCTPQVFRGLKIPEVKAFDSRDADAKQTGGSLRSEDLGAENALERTAETV